MRTLAIDCSTEACSAALFDGADLIDGHFEILGRGHAERLVPMVASLPGKGKADRVVVGLGPGSFTGVRVAIATGRALAFAWNAEIAGFPTLSLVASMARKEVGSEAVGIAMTGGHGEWFVEGFAADGKSQRGLSSLTPDLAVERTAEPVVAGTQAKALVKMRGSGQALPIMPDARAFSLLSDTALSARIEPIYGRGPDAKLPATVK